jgi:hypothetical protein
MGGVEVEAVEREVGEVEGPGGDGREDGVALGEEGVEGPAEAVVVEALGREVPKEVGPSLFGPGRDVDQGRGLAQAGREQEAEDLAVGESQLRVRGQVAVDDGSDVKPLKEWGDEGQWAKLQGIVGYGRAMPGLSHDASTGQGVVRETARSARSGTAMVGAGSSVKLWREKAWRATRR